MSLIHAFIKLPGKNEPKKTFMGGWEIKIYKLLSSDFSANSPLQDLMTFCARKNVYGGVFRHVGASFCPFYGFSNKITETKNIFSFFAEFFIDKLQNQDPPMVRNLYQSKLNWMRFPLFFWLRFCKFFFFTKISGAYIMFFHYRGTPQESGWYKWQHHEVRLLRVVFWSLIFCSAQFFYWILADKKILKFCDFIKNISSRTSTPK